MTFVNGALYRHENFRDIDMYVVRVRYRGPKYWKLTVLYFYQNESHPALAGKPIWPTGELVKVQKEHFNKWERMI